MNCLSIFSNRSADGIPLYEFGVGGMSSEELVKRLRAQRQIGYDQVYDFILRPDFKPEPCRQDVLLAKVTLADFGPAQGGESLETLLSVERLAEWSAARLVGYRAVPCSQDTGAHVIQQYKGPRLTSNNAIQFWSEPLVVPRSGLVAEMRLLFDIRYMGNPYLCASTFDRPRHLGDAFFVRLIPTS